MCDPSYSECAVTLGVRCDCCRNSETAADFGFFVPCIVFKTTKSVVQIKESILPCDGVGGFLGTLGPLTPCEDHLNATAYFSIFRQLYPFIVIV